MTGDYTLVDSGGVNGDWEKSNQFGEETMGNSVSECLLCGTFGIQSFIFIRQLESSVQGKGQGIELGASRTEVVV